MYVIGVDPGPLPGIVRLWLEYGAGPTHLLESEALQVTPRLILPTLNMLGAGDRSTVAVEQFVVGRRAARSSTPSAGVITRTMVGVVTNWATQNNLGDWRRSLRTRPAAEVKPWATDGRLEAAGLLEATKGMRHARDAARHALFCAVRDYGLPDPLSRKALL
ncbi:hypothetical protein [Actinoplanes regularis]|uniref:hypothetical protein n=1 Tax=Actinoplanes regularis TaxID=52697 RepID=UPI0024A3FA3A|nr:hypothetical protein [Actinoplanes regularis]GLW32257.1 hypothetical protein Areg01_51960 [Actinoplanes regularis]